MRLSLTMDAQTRKEFNYLYKELKKIDTTIATATWPNINDGFDYSHRDKIRKKLLAILERDK
jgi:hypothetical protein